jgi:hypothetical protein
LKPCRVELADDVTTEEQTVAYARDDPLYLLCMGLYDTSLHICQSSVPPAALPETPDQFVQLFEDETRSESFCSDVQQLEPLGAASEKTSLWVKVLNDYLASGEQCSSLCLQRLEGGKVYVNHLCKVLAWGRKLVAENGKDTKVSSDLNEEGMTL